MYQHYNNGTGTGTGIGIVVLIFKLQHRYNFNNEHLDDKKERNKQRKSNTKIGINS
jgi:hypothetical protein